MSRYLVKIKGNRIASVDALDGEDEEVLGLEWALSEVKDSYRHSKSIDGDFTLDGRSELAEFLAAIGKLVGEAALGQFRTIESVP
jgi:hypothetical protein